jgi:hypothetical protein
MPAEAVQRMHYAILRGNVTELPENIIAQLFKF